MSEIELKNDETGLFDLLPSMPASRQTWHCFASPEKIEAYLRARPIDEYWQTNAVSLDDLGDFYGGVTFGQALDMIHTGWPEGTERVAKLRDRIAVALPVKLKVAEYHVAGNLVDVPRYLAGEPKCMKRPAPRVNRARPILTLVNHVGGNAYVPAKCFVNRCAVVAAIVDAIEANGYSCHVLGVDTGQRGDYFCGIVTTVKEAGAVPDLSKLAFALGHVGLLRRVMFAVMGSDKVNRPLGHSLGNNTDFPSVNTPNVFVLPSMNTLHQFFKSEELAATDGLDALLASLRSQGCPAFPSEEVAA